jgi:hypothetical protein
MQSWTAPPEKTMTAIEQQMLEARIANLECCLHGLWLLLRDLQPPATQADIDEMMRQHFDAARGMGGCKSGGFVQVPSNT